MRPDMRAGCNEILAKVQELYDNCLKNPHYSLKQTRAVPERRDTERSILAPVPLHLSPKMNATVQRAEILDDPASRILSRRSSMRSRASHKRVSFPIGRPPSEPPLAETDEHDFADDFKLNRHIDTSHALGGFIDVDVASKLPATELRDSPEQVSGPFQPPRVHGKEGSQQQDHQAPLQINNRPMSKLSSPVKRSLDTSASQGYTDSGTAGRESLDVPQDSADQGCKRQRSISPKPRLDET